MGKLQDRREAREELATLVNLNCGQGRGESIGENSGANCSTPKPKESNLRRGSVSKLLDKILSAHGRTRYCVGMPVCHE